MGDVLTSVPGTEAARNALLEQAIPQTAEVVRSEAKLEVNFDGTPEFQHIANTDVSYSLNSDKSVMKIKQKYYCVDNGIWFASSSAKGPWQVSDTRPADVNEIEPSSSVYNVKYVYIYDSTPEMVYVGYTPGYYGSFVYGPTVIYGTGYPYYPWYGAYYYPRPVTYGFSVHYNPWTDWGIGYGFAYGPVHIRYGGYGGYGGYWGCPGYRPPYHYHGGGYYGHGGRYPAYGGGNNSNRPGYGNRPSTLPSQRPSASQGNRAGNNIYGNFAKLNTTFVNSTSFTDMNPLNGNNVYMVRAVKKISNASGSHFQMSQGMWDSAQAVNITSVASLNQNINMEVYPNPAKNVINIHVLNENNLAFKIEIYNVNGQLIFTKNTNEEMNIISTEKYASGIYYLKVFNNEFIATQKIIKE